MLKPTLNQKYNFNLITLNKKIYFIKININFVAFTKEGEGRQGLPLN